MENKILPNSLLLGGCLEIMPNIPDKSVDMILCDLPYGTTNAKWDKILPLDRLWKEYNRIIKDNGAVVLFSQLPFTCDLINANRRFFRYEIIWKKNRATGFLNAKKMPMRCHENIIVFYKSLPVYNPQKHYSFPYKKTKAATNSVLYGKRSNKKVYTQSLDGSRYPIDVIEYKIPNSGGGDKGKHPTQKPVLLLEYLIKTYTNEGETVLDNTMGSGSTCVACVNTNRKYIGIEKEENYYKIAFKRIEEAKKQPRLFY